jgi:hypothetical protein
LENSRKDFLGQDLAVGDHVLVGTPMDMGRGFKIGPIVKFSLKMVQVDLPSWNKKLTSVYPEEVFKVSPEQVTWYLLNKR